jgi:1,4-alpha-glucan branching enzyme
MVNQEDEPLGAVPHEGGVTFRVWAPNADRVSVVGVFNDWEAEADPMAKEGGGIWRADLSHAGVGDEYRYVLARGGETLSRIDPYARQVTSSAGNGVVHDPAFEWEGDAFEMPPWNELVVYELHLGTFGRELDEAPSTFEGAAAKLEHLQRLGANAIQIMPVGEFAGDFSWGYNPAHIFAVESAYGGPAELKRFIKRAHGAGLAVLLDVVYNHLGPSDLSLWQFDAWSENERGGIYFYNDWRSETPWPAFPRWTCGLALAHWGWPL